MDTLVYKVLKKTIGFFGGLGGSPPNFAQKSSASRSLQFAQLKQVQVLWLAGMLPNSTDVFETVSWASINLPVSKRVVLQTSDHEEDQ